MVFRIRTVDSLGFSPGSAGRMFVTDYSGIDAAFCTREDPQVQSVILPIVFVIRHFAHGIGALYGIVLAVVPGLTWKGRRAANVH